MRELIVMTRVPHHQLDVALIRLRKRMGECFSNSAARVRLIWTKRAQHPPDGDPIDFLHQERKEKEERKFCTQVSPIGRKVGEQWAIRLQKLPKLAPTPAQRWKLQMPVIISPFWGSFPKLAPTSG